MIKKLEKLITRMMDNPRSSRRGFVLCLIYLLLYFGFDANATFMVIVLCLTMFAMGCWMED